MRLSILRLPTIRGNLNNEFKPDSSTKFSIMRLLHFSKCSETAVLSSEEQKLIQGGFSHGGGQPPVYQGDDDDD